MVLGKKDGLPGVVALVSKRDFNVVACQSIESNFPVGIAFFIYRVH